MSGLDEQEIDIPVCKHCGETFLYWTIRIWNENTEVYEDAVYINLREMVDMGRVNAVLEVESYYDYLTMDELLSNEYIKCGTCYGDIHQNGLLAINNIVRECWNRRVIV